MFPPQVRRRTHSCSAGEPEGCSPTRPRMPTHAHACHVHHAALATRAAQRIAAQRSAARSSRPFCAVLCSRATLPHAACSGQSPSRNPTCSRPSGPLACKKRRVRLRAATAADREARARACDGTRSASDARCGGHGLCVFSPRVVCCMSFVACCMPCVALFDCCWLTSLRHASHRLLYFASLHRAALPWRTSAAWWTIACRVLSGAAVGADDADQRAAVAQARV